MRVRSLTVTGLLVAVLLGAAAVVIPAAAAPAAFCKPGTGVSVVADFGGLPGGIQAGCDANGGGSYADDVMKAVGLDWTPVQKFPGMLCRIKGEPSNASCVNAPPTNAYWGLFWSDGKSGWTYSSLGLTSLKVPEGGSIGWRWQDGGERDFPTVAPNPAAAESTTKPTPKPTPQPTDKPTPTPGQPSGEPTSQPSEGSSAAPGSPEASTDPAEAAPRGDKKRDRQDRQDRTEESPSPTADPTDPTASAAPEVTAIDDIAPASSSSEGSNVVVTGIGALLVVLLLGSALLVERRRRVSAQQR